MALQLALEPLEKEIIIGSHKGRARLVALQWEDFSFSASQWMLIFKLFIDYKRRPAAPRVPCCSCSQPHFVSLDKVRLKHIMRKRCHDIDEL